jgi:hypothetical protein
MPDCSERSGDPAAPSQADIGDQKTTSQNALESIIKLPAWIG